MKEEQIDGLIRLIEENGFATVKYLAKVTFTSESTVRRQLTELENMGLIKRSYGGAEIRKDNINTPIELRLQKNHKAKDAIARKAAEFIYDNETVFIDGSSTCLHMGQYLSAKKGLTVYTYAAELCALLAQSARKYFLCDSEKFGKRSPYILCTEKDVDGIITE